VNYVDVGTASYHIRNIEEENVILSEGHNGFVAGRIRRLFNIYPRERSAIGGLEKAHVQVEQLSMRQRVCQGVR
jgi:hypothetical protein